MKSKKVTMLAAALVVAVVAAAGIGYATTYTAKTTNANNSIDSTYITLTQEGTGASSGTYLENFFTGILYNSVNESASSTKYYLVTDSKLSDDGKSVIAGDAMATISKQLTINVDTTKSSADKVNLVVDVTLFSPIVGMEYIMIVTDGGVVVGNDSVEVSQAPAEPTTYTWAFTNIVVDPNTASNEFVVTLYVSSENGVSGSGTNFNSAGFTNYVESGQGATPGSVFTFTVSAAVN